MDDGHLRKHLRDPAGHLKQFALQEFISAARTGRLIAFVGSYATEDMGYPLWKDFLLAYAKNFPALGSPRSQLMALAERKIAGKRQRPVSPTASSKTALIDLLIENWIAINEKSKGASFVKDEIEKFRKQLCGKDFFGLTRGRKTYHATPYEIIESLGISRVITTNYDLEFEWQFMVTKEEQAAHRNRAGFFKTLFETKRIKRNEDTGGLSRRLPSGRTTHSDVFDRGRTDRLIEFAVGAPDHYGHVLHLHGRATEEDHERLVVGLGDYERQYRRSGIAKLPFEHALKLLYAGNPVIFIGNGMAEPEVTATLENFVSDNLRNHLAPAFVLWSPDAGQTDPAKIKLRDEDELRRIEWYRRFGVYTIYDCDLEGYFKPEAVVKDLGAQKIRMPRRVVHATRALGAYGKDKIPHFAWERRHMRSAQWRYDIGDGCPDPERFDVWRCDPLIKPEPPLLEVLSTNFIPTPDPNKILANFVDAEHFATLFRGAPVKAIVDRPGVGHGYLAKAIAYAFTNELGSLIKSRASVVNAGFICEIDSTFALVSGLYDGKTAFGPPGVREYQDAKSRQAALLDYEKDLEDVAASKAPLKRHLLLIINGMDRFFETSGYPLSNELDNMMRKIVQAYRKRYRDRTGAERTIHELVSQLDLVNPYTVILLGTARVERYLDGLGWECETEQSRQTGRPGDYAILSGQPQGRGRELLDLIESRNAALWDARDPKNGCPFTRTRGVPHSNYLTILQQRMPINLSPARKARRDRGIARGIGDFRHGVLEAYLRSDTIRAALHKGGMKPDLADLCLDILSSLSFFGQPVDRCVLDELPRVKRRLRGAVRPTMLDEAVTALENLGLMLNFPAFPDTPRGGARYGIHRTVMAELRNRYGVPISEAKLSAGFNLSLFASQMIDDYTPESDIHCDLGEMVDELIDAGEVQSTSKPIQPGAIEPGACLRAALLLVRNYFTTSALLMIEPPPHAPEDYRAPLTEHADRLERLLRAAETLAELRVRLRDEKKPVEGAEAFFPDDLVWLHNELGVVKLVQGDLYRARFAFESAETINANHVEYDDKLQNWRRLQLNQLQLDIERSKIRSAESRMLELERAVNEHVGFVSSPGAAPAVSGAALAASGSGARPAGPARAARDVLPVKQIVEHYGTSPHERVRVVDPHFPADAILTVGLINGYRGLCAYLKGNFKAALKQFNVAIEILRNIGEHRSYALFLKHRAALQYSMKLTEQSSDSRRNGLAAADSVRQMDLAYLYRIAEVAAATEARDISAEQHPAMSQKIVAALHYSVRADMYRVRIEARQTLAEMRFSAGDYDGALEQAADALAVAVRFGFSLRKISLRIMIGRILLKRGDPKSGNALLDQAIVNADRVGFQRAVERAQSVRYEYSQLYRA